MKAFEHGPAHWALLGCRCGSRRTGQGVLCIRRARHYNQVQARRHAWQRHANKRMVTQ